MVSKSVDNVVYETVHISDLSDILKIERISARVPWTERLFLNELNSSRSVCLVARVGGAAIGYIFSYHVLDEGNILNVAVHPDFRRRGIASELLRRMIEMLKEYGCMRMYLEVRVSNKAAIELYEKAGFRNIGTRKNYYISPQEDAVIMSLSPS